MLLIDLSLLILLAVALVFSIIELGLSADAVSQGTEHGTYFADGEGGFYFGLAHGGPSSIASFLLFASLWSCLVSGVLLGLPFVQKRRALATTPASNASTGAGSTGGGSYARQYWLELLTLTLNAVTMIFWLAGFADLANLDDANGGSPQGVAGALLAFAVLLWLVFLTLLVLNILTAVAVLESETLGYKSLKRGPSTTTHPAQPAAVAGGGKNGSAPPVMSEVSHDV